MSRRFDAHNLTARYAGLGLTSNPFLEFGGTGESPAGREVTFESNILLNAIVAAAAEDAPRPVWVSESTDIPEPYALSAESRVEAILTQDKSLSILHTYVPLFAMKSGVVRSTLGLLSERLLFRDFDTTLALYVDRILAEPDETLVSYQVLGPDGLAQFAAEFAEDRLAAIHAVLGTPERERQPDLAEVADFRQFDFDGDVDEDGATIEIDNTVGDAPGTMALMANRAAESEGSNSAAVCDYLIEYTREHLSPVIGRALRVYQDRGLTAAVAEIKITKAPRKTLVAVARLAQVRYKKVVVMYGGFQNWLEIDPALRSKIVGFISEVRWAIADCGVLALIVREGRAPELEETFGAATKVSWDFPGLLEMEDHPNVVFEPIVDKWLAAATVPGSTPMTTKSPAIAAVLDAAGGKLDRLVDVAETAIEIAADAEATELSVEHVSAAIAQVDAADPAASEDVS